MGATLIDFAACQKVKAELGHYTHQHPDLDRLKLQHIEGWGLMWVLRSLAAGRRVERWVGVYPGLSAADALGYALEQLYQDGLIPRTTG